jgi:hypothetical protein
VEIDVDRLLRRVVADVMDDDVKTVYSVDPKRPHTYLVDLGAQDGRRQVRLRATYEWFEITILDLGATATLFEYDEDEADKERVLRELALVAQAYLRGEGTVDYKRGLFRSRPVLKVTVNGRDWKLSRRISQVHYPAPDSHS